MIHGEKNYVNTSIQELQLQGFEMLNSLLELCVCDFLSAESPGMRRHTRLMIILST